MLFERVIRDRFADIVVMRRSIIEYYEGDHGVEVRQLWGMTEITPAGTLGALKGTMAHLGREEVTRLKLKQVGLSRDVRDLQGLRYIFGGCNGCSCGGRRWPASSCTGLKRSMWAGPQKTYEGCVRMDAPRGKGVGMHGKLCCIAVQDVLP